MIDGAAQQPERRQREARQQRRRPGIILRHRVGEVDRERQQLALPRQRADRDRHDAVEHEIGDHQILADDHVIGVERGQRGDEPRASDQRARGDRPKSRPAPYAPRAIASSASELSAKAEPQRVGSPAAASAQNAATRGENLRRTAPSAPPRPAPPDPARRRRRQRPEPAPAPRVGDSRHASAPTQSAERRRRAERDAARRARSGEGKRRGDVGHAAKSAREALRNSRKLRRAALRARPRALLAPGLEGEQQQRRRDQRQADEDRAR